MFSCPSNLDSLSINDNSGKIKWNKIKIKMK
jgi:hypothetical protein